MLPAGGAATPRQVQCLDKANVSSGSTAQNDIPADGMSFFRCWAVTGWNVRRACPNRSNRIDDLSD